MATPAWITECGTVLGGVPRGIFKDGKPRVQLKDPVVMEPLHVVVVNNELVDAGEDPIGTHTFVHDGASRIHGYDAADFFRKLDYGDIADRGSEFCGMQLVPYNKDMNSPDASTVFSACGGTAGLVANIPAHSPLRHLRSNKELEEALEVLFTYHQYANPVFVASVVVWTVVNDIEVCLPIRLTDEQQAVLWKAAQASASRTAQGEPYPGPGPNGLSLFLERGMAIATSVNSKDHNI